MSILVTSTSHSGEIVSQITDEFKVYKAWNMHTLDKGMFELYLDAVYLFDNDIMINPDALKRSLSIALKSYPLFSGRMNPLNDFQIILNDQGVLFTMAEDLNTSIKDIVDHEEDIPKGKFVDYPKSLNPIIKGKESLMRVKYTKVKDGCILGVWVTHGVSDGATYYNFIRNWSKICDEIVDSSSPNASIMFEPDVIIDQSLVPFHDYTRRSKEALGKVLKKLNWKVVSIPVFLYYIAELYFKEGLTLLDHERTKPIRFSTDDLKRMKQSAEIDAKQHGVDSVTTNEALVAFLCQLMGYLFEFNKDKQMSHYLPVNWRTRLNNVPENFVGNASSLLKTCSFTPNESIGTIAAHMHKGLEKYKSDTKELREIVSVIFDVIHHGWFASESDPSQLPFINRLPSSVVTNNFAPYPIYDVSFGTDNKPIKVLPHHCGDQIIIWPTPNNQGLDVYFQGATSKRIKSLSPDSHWFTELFKYSNAMILSKFNSQIDKGNTNTGTQIQPKQKIEEEYDEEDDDEEEFNPFKPSPLVVTHVIEEKQKSKTSFPSFKQITIAAIAISAITQALMAVARN